MPIIINILYIGSPIEIALFFRQKYTKYTRAPVKAHRSTVIISTVYRVTRHNNNLCVFRIFFYLLGPRSKLRQMFSHSIPYVYFKNWLLTGWWLVVAPRITLNENRVIIKMPSSVHRHTSSSMCVFHTQQ